MFTLGFNQLNDRGKYESSRQAGNNVFGASHAHLEDDALFKELEQHIGSDGPIGVMRMEHDEIESTLVRILQATERDDAKQMALHAIEVARSHFSKEENILFPMAEQMLSEDVRKLVARGFAAIGSCCPECEHKARPSEAAL